METVIIAAVARNRVIGKDGRIPWHISEDFRHFKRATTGHAVIMGRKTYESLGRPLPERVNIVLSRSMPLPDDKRYMVASSIEKALALCERAGAEKAFIIGGAEVYKEALEKRMPEKLIITELKEAYEGDAFFPEPGGEWHETHREGHDGFDLVTYTLGA